MIGSYRISYIFNKGTEFSQSWIKTWECWWLKWDFRSHWLGFNLDNQHSSFIIGAGEFLGFVHASWPWTTWSQVALLWEGCHKQKSPSIPANLKYSVFVQKREKVIARKSLRSVQATLRLLAAAEEALVAVVQMEQSELPPSALQWCLPLQ